MVGRPRLTKEQIESIWLPDGYELINWEIEKHINSRGVWQRTVMYNIRCPNGHIRNAARHNVLEFPDACMECSGRGYRGRRRRSFNRIRKVSLVLKEEDGTRLLRCERHGCWHTWRTKEIGSACPKCTKIT